MTFEQFLAWLAATCFIVGGAGLLAILWHKVFVVQHDWVGDYQEGQDHEQEGR